MSQSVDYAAQGPEFVWPVRVYWEDTDAGGVVFYANYLKFLERARTEWLRSFGIEQVPLLEQTGVLMVVARVEANYRRPARYADDLRVYTRVTEGRRASVVFEQRIVRLATPEARDGELLFDALVKVASIDATTFRPTPFPDVVVGSLQIA